MLTEEEDYMSDKFLLPSCDVRTGLIHQHSTKRLLLIEKKRKDAIQKQKDLKNRFSSHYVLQESLKKPLQTDNKGFQMLTKLGYKPGQALGKPLHPSSNEMKDSKLIEPISITLKTDRQGLGHKNVTKEMNKKDASMCPKRTGENDIKGEINIEEFRKRVTHRVDERSIAKDLRSCQITCENLDLKINIDNKLIENKIESLENESEDSNKVVIDECTIDEKLCLLISYLRNSHNFCYWCGIQFNNQGDLLNHCPGLSKGDH